ncbi:MAG: hypothetical protein WBA54_01880 [Acidaminobacteraceae bacterium]
MMRLKAYIKKYGIIIVFIAFGLAINSSINPYIVGDSFKSKKNNEDYRVKTTEIFNAELKEISGIAYSDKHKLFWVHNDSGNSSDIYALGEDGDTKLVVKLDDIENIDFEDISLRTYNDKNMLYIADIGNNDLKRTEMYIYRFEEPLYTKETSNKIRGNIIVNLIPDVLTLDVADLGINFEAMMVENKTGKIFLVEKVKSKKARVYIISKFDVDENNVFPSYYGEIDFEMYGKQEVVALDISKDDKYILIKTKSNVFMLDRNDFTKNVTSDRLKQMPYVEEYQGEAISWSSKSLGYFTASESKSKKPTNIYFYRNVYK